MLKMGRPTPVLEIKKVKRKKKKKKKKKKNHNKEASYKNICTGILGRVS